ncbi:MAG: PEGA domain-containing protein [Trueperaceae bacterium]|nr:MAG: PEGA domain-containing protein [Trueperaceae bacterium]
MASRRIATSLLASLLAPLLAGCALLVSGTTQTVPIESHPERAEVLLDGVSQGFTPLELRLPRGQEHTLTLRVGDQSRTVLLTPRVQGGLLALDAAPPALLAVGTVLWCNPPRGTEVAEPVRAIGCTLGALLTIGATAPLLVDAGTGALYALAPSAVVVTFD